MLQRITSLTMPCMAQPVLRAGDCSTQCGAAHSHWPDQPSGAAYYQLPEQQHARRRHPSASARAAVCMAVLRDAGLVQKCMGSRWRHSRCMRLHILVGLVGLAAQPLSLCQRCRMRLLAALAAVLVVIQLLVRCRLLLPASRRTTHYHWAMLCLGPTPCNSCARAAACSTFSAQWQFSPQ